MKSLLKKIIYLSIPLALLSGCNSDKKEDTFHTVEYYVKDKSIRDARKEECSNMKTMTKTILRDCKNVDIAIMRTSNSGTTSDTTGFFK